MKREEGLLALGLTQHEARVYSALLNIRIAGVRELSGATGIHRPHVYTALQRLVDKGMVSRSHGKVGTFEAFSPREVFSRKMSETRDLLKLQAKTVRQLEQAYRNRKDNGQVKLFEVFRPGSAGLAEELRRVSRARKELLTMFKRHPPGITEEELDACDEVEIRLIKRGVTVRCVYERAAFDDKVRLPHLMKVIKAGEQARVVEEVPMGLVIVDNSSAAFGLATTPEDRTGVFVNSPALVRLLRDAFEFHWQRGSDARQLVAGATGGER
ncbi:MAG: helix-turn-helix domain-containing protein [candidate division WOR-3 bacterium]